MNRARRIAVIPLGLSLGVFLVITYTLCVLFGLIVPAEPMHQLLPMLLPGFSWITCPSIVQALRPYMPMWTKQRKQSSSSDKFSDTDHKISGLGA